MNKHLVEWTVADWTLTTPIKESVRGIPEPRTTPEGQGERDKL
jgi:hypothetical protein